MHCARSGGVPTRHVARLVGVGGGCAGRAGGGQTVGTSAGWGRRFAVVGATRWISRGPLAVRSALCANTVVNVDRSGRGRPALHVMAVVNVDRGAPPARASTFPTTTVVNVDRSPRSVAAIHLDHHRPRSPLRAQLRARMRVVDRPPDFGWVGKEVRRRWGRQGGYRAACRGAIHVMCEYGRQRGSFGRGRPALHVMAVVNVDRGAPPARASTFPTTTVVHVDRSPRSPAAITLTTTARALP